MLPFLTACFTECRYWPTFNEAPNGECGLIGSIITATVGAIVLLFIVGLIKKA